MKKRLIAALLALCMVVTLLPVSAFAAEQEYLWPVPGNYTVNSFYGEVRSKHEDGSVKSRHKGIDIGVGNSVVATKSGTVMVVYNGCENTRGFYSSCQSTGKCDASHNYQSSCNNTCNFGYGNGVIIKHSDGSGYSMYAHMGHIY